MGSLQKPTPVRPQPLKFLINGDIKSDRLTSKAIGNPGCMHTKCMGSIMRPPPERPANTLRSTEELLTQAKEFIDEYYGHLNKKDSPQHKNRWSEILSDIESTGTYDNTTEELAFGSKTAWRNAPRCIGRIQWKNLRCIDARHVKTAREMFEVVLEHLDYANNGGNLRSCITVFPKRTDGKHDFKVWNQQFITFAGYRQEDGSIMGDPANVDITEVCFRLGWQGGSPRTRFDVLPLVLQANGEKPEYFEVPKELVVLVDLKHPKYAWFHDLKLKWFGVPAVANMLFDCGGIEYTAAPFNGWYMGTEVGSRDLCDPNRYNIVEMVAKHMDVDTKQNISLWRDRVVLEVNTAVLHSYKSSGVTMVDHHTASDQFMSHLETEYRVRGGCPADWVWIVPPLSSSALPTFHMEMLHYKLKPSYEYQIEPWKTYRWGDQTHKKRFGMKTLCKVILAMSSMMVKAHSRRTKCTILYATETGKSVEYSKLMRKITHSAFHVKLLCMDEYNMNDLHKEQLLLVITSTFGNGDPPDNGVDFFEALQHIDTKHQDFHNVKFSVFALGSSAYPNFCEFGHDVDEALDHLGCQRIHSLGEGDELQGQEERFMTWAIDCVKTCCHNLGIDVSITDIDKMGGDSGWASHRYRYVVESKHNGNSDVRKDLEIVHKKDLVTTKIKGSAQLQPPDSSGQTLFINLDSQDMPELDYEAGDHIAICPENDKHLVDEIVKRLPKVPAPDLFFKLQSQKKSQTDKSQWHTSKKLPSLVSIRYALTHLLDITSPPHQHLLHILSNLCRSEEDRDKLEHLAKDAYSYNVWRSRMPGLLDLLVQFPSLILPGSFLLTQLPHLQPRFYSISSAPAMYPGEIHVTATVVQYTVGEGKDFVTRYGVCTNWLLNQRIGNKVHCYIRKNEKFRLEENDQSPVIMVGPGTGIAPLRSFWQQRFVEKTEQRKKAGEMTLYFGCRNHDKDNLFKQERSKMSSVGVLTSYTALSREPGRPKTYVQDLLARDGKSIFKQVVQQNGHVYVCGAVDMAAGVRLTLQQILESYGSMDPKQAKQFLDSMRKSNKYHEDIFGSLKAPTVGKKETIYSANVAKLPVNN